MSSEPIDTFPNPEPSRQYEIAINCPEFTSLCPKTGLPDFGEIRITYLPAERCIELNPDMSKAYLIPEHAPLERHPIGALSSLGRHPENTIEIHDRSVSAASSTNR